MAARFVRAVLTVAAATLAAAAVSFGSAAPVGKLPKGPTIPAHLGVGKTYTVVIPKPKVAGRVWRIARPVNGKVVREVAEGETAGSIWVRFRGVASGTAKVVFALTLGERSHAYAARTWSFSVRR